MKEAFADVVGNDGLRQRLGDDILKGTLAHAYILAGPRGSGKHTIALRFAAALACERRGDDGYALPCLTCPTCRKILEGKSPDIILIQKDGQSVKIEQIRTLKNDVFTMPNDLEHKIYIIEDADTMTEAAQNAFLLTLEEPPAFVRFFLLCEKPEKLLETVRSRAPSLRTEILPRALVAAQLKAQSEVAATLAKTKPQEFEEILTIAAGCIGRGLDLCDEKERAPLLKQRKIASDLVETALSRRYAPLTELIVSLPKKQDELLPILGLAQSALRDMIALKSTADAPLVFYTDREEATELAFAHGTKALIALYNKLSVTLENISRNANIRLSLVSLLAKI
jgi:DNA polymerase-3 subunit delta'